MDRPTEEEKALVLSYCQGCAAGKVLFRDAFAAARKDAKLARFDDKTLKGGMHWCIDQIAGKR